jgi:hypothetical protein
MARGVSQIQWLSAISKGVYSWRQRARFCRKCDAVWVTPSHAVQFRRPQARVAKSVDARDLKSLGRKAVPVRVRLRADLGLDLLHLVRFELLTTIH